MIKWLYKVLFAGVTVTLLSLLTPNVRADSPLTSTTFYTAYQDVELVQIAKERKLTPQLLAALSDSNVPNDIRAAIINALGISFEGQDNAKIYLNYSARSRGKKPSELTLADLTPQETFSLGYLLAMDDYFTLKAIGGVGEVERTDALSLLKKAVDRFPQDFIVALIYQLAQSQIYLSNGQLWCRIYTSVSEVAENYDGQKNMRPTAVKIVMDYIVLYQDSCPSR